LIKRDNKIFRRTIGKYFKLCMKSFNEMYCFEKVKYQLNRSRIFKTTKGINKYYKYALSILSKIYLK